jgi:hypothetical protein
VSAEPRRIQQQRSEPLDPPVQRDVINLDAAFDKEFFNVAIGQRNRRYQRTATTITSGGNLNPVNADVGGSQRRGRIDSFTGQACLDHADAQCNRAAKLKAERAALGDPSLPTGDTAAKTVSIGALMVMLAW